MVRDAKRHYRKTSRALCSSTDGWPVAGCRGGFGRDGIETAPGIMELNQPFLLGSLQIVAASIIGTLGQLPKCIILIIMKNETLMVLVHEPRFYPVGKNHGFKSDRCA